jgi:hypothetical protein
MRASTSLSLENLGREASKTRHSRHASNRQRDNPDRRSAALTMAHRLAETPRYFERIEPESKRMLSRDEISTGTRSEAMNIR